MRCSSLPQPPQPHLATASSLPGAALHTQRTCAVLQVGLLLLHASPPVPRSMLGGPFQITLPLQFQESAGAVGEASAAGAQPQPVSNYSNHSQLLRAWVGAQQAHAGNPSLCIPIPHSLEDQVCVAVHRGRQVRRVERRQRRVDRQVLGLRRKA